METRTIYDQRTATDAAAPDLTPEACADVLGRLEFIAPRSGNVHGIAMLGDALFVKFQGGKVYRYTAKDPALVERPESVRAHYDAMLTVNSAGSYFAANLRNNKAIHCQLIGTHAETVLSERHENGDGV